MNNEHAGPIQTRELEPIKSNGHSHLRNRNINMPMLWHIFITMKLKQYTERFVEKLSKKCRQIDKYKYRKRLFRVEENKRKD